MRTSHLPKVSQAPPELPKSPVHVRSSVSVDAIQEATIQVLLSTGKEHLTPTRVAQRAGVSVGTLYQYYPNKSSLLHAVLRRHMEEVTRAVEAACRENKGASLQQMADALVTAFLHAKLSSVKASKALYFVSDDVGGAEIARVFGVRGTKAVAEMLASSGAIFSEDVDAMASTVMAVMSGVSRRMLESDGSPKTLEAMRKGLQVMVRAYLSACVIPCNR